jgi:hypothetical protein
MSSSDEKDAEREPLTPRELLKHVRDKLALEQKRAERAEEKFRVLLLAVQAHVDYWNDDSRCSDGDSEAAEFALRMALASVAPRLSPAKVPTRAQNSAATEDPVAQTSISVCPSVVGQIGLPQGTPVYCDQDRGHTGKHTGYSEVQGKDIAWNGA